MNVDQDLTDLRQRAMKLAQEKSYLLLINQLMSKLGAAAGLENTIETMLKVIVESIGGTNIILYYVIDKDIYYADVYGKKQKLENIADTLVQQVFDTREYVEAESEFNDTQLLMPEFTKAWTWVFPLCVGDEVIGVLKMENLHIATRELQEQLPIFFNYTALILKSEILGYTKLKTAYDQLSLTNIKLLNEIAKREQVEDELRKAKEELEEKVVQRTAQLQNVNKQLQKELADRRRAEKALEKSAQEIHDLYNKAPCGYHSLDKDGVYIRINDTEAQWLGYTREEMLGKIKFDDLLTPASRQSFADNFPLFKDRGWVRDLEFDMIRKDGATVPVLLNATAVTDAAGNYVMSRSTIYDITERKRAEEQRLAYLHFLENMDRVNRAIVSATDVQQMLGDIIKTVRDIFDCDRAWLLYPCDPDALSFRVPVESHRPEYPGAFALNVDVPIGVDEAQVLRDALASDELLRGECGTTTPPPPRMTEQFGVRSQMLMAIHPKIGKAWLLGLHQCSYDRIWTDDEQRLFKEIGRRISDSLSSLLFFRNLQKSEERYRSVITAMAEGIVVQDADGVIQTCNPAAEHIMGLFANQIKGRISIDPRGEAVHEDGTPFPDETHPAMVTLRTGKPCRNVTMGVRYRDARVWILINSEPLFQPGQTKPYAVVTSFSDITERKLAEERLRQSNRMLQILSACNQVLVRVTDEKLLLHEICRLIVEIGGYPLAWVGIAEQDEAKTVRPAAGEGFEPDYLDTLDVHWDDTERGRGPTGKAIRSGRPYIVLDILTDPDFAPWREEAIRRGYASSIALPLHGEGCVFGSLNIYASQPDAFHEKEVYLLEELASDLEYGITSLHVRAELRQSQERFKSLVETAPAVILCLSPDYLITEFNPAARRLYGRKREEVLGKNYLELFLPADIREMVANNIKKVLVGEPARGFENPVLTADGTERVLVWNIDSMLDAGGNASEIIAVGQDITERKRAEEALHKSEADLRAIFNAVNETLVLLTVDGIVLAINSTGAARLGKTPEEVIGENISHLWPDEAASKRLEAARSVISSGMQLIFEDQREEYYFRNSVYLLSGSGESGGTVVLFSEDITDRKKVEREREELLKTLSAKNKELESILFATSHDLRTPIVNLSGFVHELESSCGELIQILGETDLPLSVNERIAHLVEVEIRQFLRYITTNTVTLNSLLNGIMIFCRLGVRPPALQTVDVNTLVTQIVESMEFQIQEAHATVTVNDLPRCQAEINLLRQVFANLLDNALKYLDPSRPGQIRFSGRKEGENRIYCIEDNGIGIDPKYQAKIFEIFYRLNPEKPVGGEGLGLTIAQRIVEQHNGKMWVESDTDKGCKFFVLLPK